MLQKIPHIFAIVVGSADSSIYIQKEHWAKPLGVEGGRGLGVGGWGDGV